MEQQGQIESTVAAHPADGDDVVAVALEVIDSATQAWSATRTIAEKSADSGTENGES